MTYKRLGVSRMSEQADTAGFAPRRCLRGATRLRRFDAPPGERDGQVAEERHARGDGAEQDVPIALHRVAPQHCNQTRCASPHKSTLRTPHVKRTIPPWAALLDLRLI